MSSLSSAAMRPAGIAQGFTLVACAWLAVLASAALLGPVLPRMTQYFQANAHVEVLISLVATLPAFGVALLSVPFGWLADRVGHRRVLFWATLVYGALGVLPYFLDSLPAIVAARAVVGVAEAVIMTCSAALIGHYFSGKRREYWYALQTGSTPVVAFVAIGLGGVLGEYSWHVPFLAYSFGVVLFIAVAALLREPQHVTATAQSGALSAAQPEAPFHWLPLVGISLLTVLAMIGFMIPTIQTGFLLTERGIPSPRTIGIWQSLSSLSSPLGALLVSLLRWRAITKVAVSFALMAAGFGVIGVLPSWQQALEGGVIANLGCGMMLPTLITWALSDLPPSMRGRGAGAWMTASFLGQFLSPLVIVMFKQFTGTLSAAIGCYGIVCVLGAVIAAIGMRRRAPG